MKNFIRIMAEDNLLHRVQSGHVAVTYRLTAKEVDDEILKNLPEGDAK